MQLEEVSQDRDAENVLHAHKFLPGDQMATTLFGMLLDNAQQFAAEFHEESPFEGSDEERMGEALQDAVLNARTRKDYLVMMQLSMESMAIEHDASIEAVDFENIPTPAEARRIFIEMGKQQFPELTTVSIDDVVELWRKLNRTPLPDYLAEGGRDLNRVLDTLREAHHSVLTAYNSCILDQSNDVRAGVQLMFAILKLEEKLEKQLGVDGHPDMSQTDKDQADQVRNVIRGETI